MKINLEKLLSREIDNLDLNFCEKIDSINYCDNSYKLTTPMCVEGKIRHTSDGIYLDCEVQYSIADNCGRCLDDVEVELQYPVQGFIVKEEIDEDKIEEHDVYVYTDETIDLLPMIEDSLSFNMPQRTLCNEECKGLCQNCGANLNKGECSCDTDANDEESIDPRLAKLQNFFKKD